MLLGLYFSNIRQLRLFPETVQLIVLSVFTQYACQANIFEGLLWVVVPIVLVTLNEFWYVCFTSMLGRTNLISRFSPLSYQGLLGSWIANSLLIACVGE